MIKDYSSKLRELSEEFKRPLMILEGDDLLYGGMVNPNAIRGSIASIALDFGISIIPTRNAQDTAAMIKRIAVREQTGEKTQFLSGLTKNRSVYGNSNYLL